MLVNGDSTLIITPKNKKILIDGGGVENEKYNVGEKVLLSYLLNRKITCIDYAIISHFDTDHCQGIIYLLDKIKIKNVIIGKQFEESKNYKKFLKLIKENNVKVISVDFSMMKNRKINIEKNINLNILWPDENNIISENKLNNNSLVFKFNYKNISILFTGDIEKEAEEEIISKYKNSQILKTTILKVAHHGSKTSSTEDFINLVNPKIALIGVGENNKFGHPAQQTIELLQSLNCKIFRTDKMGEIEIRVKKNGRLKVKKFIEQQSN